MPEGEVISFKIRAKFIACKEAADWLVGAAFQRGPRVAIKCATPCLYHVHEKHTILFVLDHLSHFFSPDLIVYDLVFITNYLEDAVCMRLLTNYWAIFTYV